MVLVLGTQLHHWKANNLVLISSWCFHGILGCTVQVRLDILNNVCTSQSRSPKSLFLQVKIQSLVIQHVKLFNSILFATSIESRGRTFRFNSLDCICIGFSKHRFVAAASPPGAVQIPGLNPLQQCFRILLRCLEMSHKVKLGIKLWIHSLGLWMLVRTCTGTDLIDEPMKKSGSFGAFVNCLRLCPAVSSDKIHSIRCKTSSQRQTRGIPVDHEPSWREYKVVQIVETILLQLHGISLLI